MNDRIAPGDHHQTSLAEGDEGRQRGECVCCGAASWQRHFVAHSQHGRASRFERCQSCGLVTLDVQLDPQTIAEAYDESYYGGGLRKLVGGLQGVRVRYAAKKAARVSRMCGPGRRLFDVGCGEGLFLRAMVERGWRGEGNEIGQTALGRAERVMDTTLFDRDLLDIPIEDGTYDAVTLWQVFEHLDRPVETLQKAHRMLRTDGLLAVSVPNPRSWQARLFGRHWLHLDPPRHLYLFSPQNLSALLRKHGFEPFLEVRNPLEFGPIGYVQSVMNAMGIRRDVFFELLKTKGVNGQTPRLKSAVLIGLAAVLTPAAILMSLIESVAGCSATFELYARKRAPR